MTTIIVEVDGIELTTLKLSQQLTACIRRVANSACVLLAKEKVRSDGTPSNPDFLALCQRGATRLGIIGARKEALLMIDATYLIDAHTAACVAATSRGLTKRERIDLLEVLGFLAAILPLWVATDRLPPWKEIQHTGKSSGRAPQIYEMLREGRANEIGFYPIKLIDALVLLEGLKLKIHPATQRLSEDLNQITITHRTALAHLMRSKE